MCGMYCHCVYRSMHRCVWLWPYVSLWSYNTFLHAGHDDFKHSMTDFLHCSYHALEHNQKHITIATENLTAKLSNEHVYARTYVPELCLCHGYPLSEEFDWRPQWSIRSPPSLQQESSPAGCPQVVEPEHLQTGPVQWANDVQNCRGVANPLTALQHQSLLWAMHVRLAIYQTEVSRLKYMTAIKQNCDDSPITAPRTFTPNGDFPYM